MQLKTLLIPLLVLCPWAKGRAATVLASYGAYEQDASRANFYTLEASSAKKSLEDFEFISVNHIDGQTIHDSLEVISRGLGFDFEPLRLNIDIGYCFSMDKYALDEI